MIRRETDAGGPPGTRTVAQVTGNAAAPRTSSPVQARCRIAGIIARPGAPVKGMLRIEGLRPPATSNGGFPESLWRRAGFRPAVPAPTVWAEVKPDVADRGRPEGGPVPPGAHQPVRAGADPACLRSLRRSRADAEVGGD